MTAPQSTATPLGARPGQGWRADVLLAAPGGQQGNGSRGDLSRRVTPPRRGVPRPASTASTASCSSPSPISVPVPTPAHPTLRAIRVRRSPR